MTAFDVLFELDQLGCRVLLEGENIRVIPPEGVTLTDDLRQAIRKNKAEIISLLRKLEQARGERLLKEYGWVAVYSETLGETVLWCRNAKVAIPTRWKDAVRYTLSELKELTGWPITEEDLQLLHAAKKNFNGTLETVK